MGVHRDCDSAKVTCRHGSADSTPSPPGLQNLHCREGGNTKEAEGWESGRTCQSWQADSAWPCAGHSCMGFIHSNSVHSHNSRIHSHITGEETEAQRGGLPCPGTQASPTEEPGARLGYDHHSPQPAQQATDTDLLGPPAT